MQAEQNESPKKAKHRKNMELLAIVKKELSDYPHLEVVEKIGQGSFGDIFKVWDSKRNGWAAVKFEKSEKNNRYSLIKREAQILQKLKEQKHFSTLFDSRFSEKSDYDFIEMTLQGMNLETLKRKNNGKFSLRTVLLIANQLISGFQVLHEKGIIHRDIKPENIVIGNEGQHHQVFIIDFGLSKYYISANKNHIKMKSNKSLIGTARYTSINSHLGLEQSRRDDLQSLAYLLLYFAKGTLFWQNLQLKDKEQRFKRIAELKQTTSNEDLCRGLPKQFNEFLNLVKSLKFEQTPEYDRYRELFKQCYDSNFTTAENLCCFDWCPVNCILRPKFLNKIASTKNINEQSSTNISNNTNIKKQHNNSQENKRIQNSSNQVDQNRNKISANKSKDINDQSAIQVQPTLNKTYLDNYYNGEEDNLDEMAVSELRQAERKRIPVFLDNSQKHKQLFFYQTNPMKSDTFHNNKIMKQNNFEVAKQANTSQIQINQSFEDQIRQTASSALNKHLANAANNNIYLPTQNKLGVQPLTNDRNINKYIQQYPFDWQNQWNSEQDENVVIQPFHLFKTQNHNKIF